MIDISGFEERDPIRDYEILRAELKAYDEKLLDKPFLVALNKVDMEGAEENIKRFRKKFKSDSKRIFEISALEGKDLKPLLEAIRTAKALRSPRSFLPLH